ncbi:MAG TPA: hypothetical protein VGN80_08420 [Devosiaceae bacterium]|nr:hypothetical protein [Devosiaceae bacterium]
MIFPDAQVNAEIIIFHHALPSLLNMEVAAPTKTAKPLQSPQNTSRTIKLKEPPRASAGGTRENRLV